MNSKKKFIKRKRKINTKTLRGGGGNIFRKDKGGKGKGSIGRGKGRGVRVKTLPPGYFVHNLKGKGGFSQKIVLPQPRTGELQPQPRTRRATLQPRIVRAISTSTILQPNRLGISKLSILREKPKGVAAAHTKNVKLTSANSMYGAPTSVLSARESESQTAKVKRGAIRLAKKAGRALRNGFVAVAMARIPRI